MNPSSTHDRSALRAGKGTIRYPWVETRGGVLFVNPGSAGPRRFKLPVAVGELMIAGDQVDARIIQLT